MLTPELHLSAKAATGYRGVRFLPDSYGKAKPYVAFGPKPASKYLGCFATAKEAASAFALFMSGEREGDEVTIDDVECAKCGRTGDASQMLVCDGDGCTVAQHTYCCSPPLITPPAGDWFCGGCTLKRQPTQGMTGRQQMRYLQEMAAKEEADATAAVVERLPMVEALLDKRTRKRRVQYLVRWSGRPAAYDSWEWEKEIDGGIIDEYEAEEGVRGRVGAGWRWGLGAGGGEGGAQDAPVDGAGGRVHEHAGAGVAGMAAEEELEAPRCHGGVLTPSPSVGSHVSVWWPSTRSRGGCWYEGDVVEATYAMGSSRNGLTRSFQVRYDDGMAHWYEDGEMKVHTIAAELPEEAHGEAGEHGDEPGAEALDAAAEAHQPLVGEPAPAVPHNQPFFDLNFSSDDDDAFEDGFVDA